MLTWHEVKRKPGTTRETDDGAWSITNPAPSDDGGKWQLYSEVGQRQLIGEFDTLADAKAEADAKAHVRSA